MNLRGEDYVDIACPTCGSRRSGVVETRTHAGHRLRRRRCCGCKSTFVTVEIIAGATMREAMRLAEARGRMSP